MIEGMSYIQLIEWLAYYTIEPFGEERDDVRAGIVASTIANTQRRKGKKAFKPSDFMPFSGNSSKAETKTEIVDVLRAWVGAAEKNKG
jgi:hypothetical protein